MIMYDTFMRPELGIRLRVIRIKKPIPHSRRREQVRMKEMANPEPLPDQEEIGKFAEENKWVGEENG